MKMSVTGYPHTCVFTLGRTKQQLQLATRV
jgi:hypothetical protein